MAVIKFVIDFDEETRKVTVKKGRKVFAIIPEICGITGLEEAILEVVENNDGFDMTPIDGYERDDLIWELGEYCDNLYPNEIAADLETFYAISKLMILLREDKFDKAKAAYNDIDKDVRYNLEDGCCGKTFVKLAQGS